MGDFREQRDDGGRGPSPDNKYPPRRGDSRERRDDPRGPPPSEESASVIVRNISFRVYPDEIHRLFSYYGRLKDVYIPRDFNTKRPKGYAFVEFFDRRDAQDAIYRLDGYELDGRRIAVSEAKDKRKTPDELRARQGDRRAPPDDRDRRGGSRRSRSRDRQSRGGDSRREGRGDRDGNQQRERKDEVRRSRSRDHKERSSSPNAFEDRRNRSRSREQEEVDNEN